MTRMEWQRPNVSAGAFSNSVVPCTTAIFGAGNLTCSVSVSILLFANGMACALRRLSSTSLRPFHHCPKMFTKFTSSVCSAAIALASWRFHAGQLNASNSVLARPLNRDYPLTQEPTARHADPPAFRCPSYCPRGEDSWHLPRVGIHEGSSHPRPQQISQSIYAAGKRPYKDGRRLESFMRSQPISASYLYVLKIPLLGGRLFTDADRLGSAGVAISIKSGSPVLAARESAECSGFHWERTGTSFAEPAREIVGVVGNVHDNALGEQP